MLGMHYPGMGEKAVIAITLRAILFFTAKSMTILRPLSRPSSLIDGVVEMKPSE
jgi:hypothetical protein